MSYQLEPNKGGRTRINLSRGKVEHAISITNSMRQAAIYLNLSYNIFKREAKKHSLWAPGKTTDVKKVHSGALSSAMLVKILRGEQMMNYRETLLLKKAFHEAYLEKKCSNCDADFTHILEPETPPLVLDFLDRDSRNGKQENLRVLCLNCVYELRAKHRGWYRHREIPINRVIDDQLPPKIEIKDESLEFIPFENFQKTLNN